MEQYSRDKFIKELAKTFNLGNAAIPYLDSIAFQEEQELFQEWKIKNNLIIIAEIASRYSNPVFAAKEIDNSLPEYVKNHQS